MVSSRLRALAGFAVQVKYRDVFSMPHLGRMVDIERTLLYIAAMVATLTIARLPRVIVPMLVCSAIGAAFSGSRLVRRKDPLPLPSMMVDLVLVAVMTPIALPQPWAASMTLAFLIVEFTLLEISLARYSAVIVATAGPHLV